MTYLLVQIALPILGAYLIGAVLGCVLRRFFGSVFDHEIEAGKKSSELMAGNQPVIEVSDPAASAGGDQSRFERALSQGPAVRDQTVSQGDIGASGASGSGPAASEEVILDSPTFSPVQEPVAAPSVEQASPAPDVSPVAPPPGAAASEAKSDPELDVDEGEPFTSVSVAAAAAAAAIATHARVAQAKEPEPELGPESDTELEPEPVREPAPEAAPAPSTPQDAGLDSQELTRIKGIDRDIEHQLKEAGVSRFEHIAAWEASDLHHVESLLSCPGRITQENWIEQAQILSGGGLTAFARGLENEEAVLEDNASHSDVSAKASLLQVTPVEFEQTDTGVSAASMAAATAAAATVAAATSISTSPVARNFADEEIAFDPLHRINGVDEQAAGWLNGLGITRFEQIANWSDRDVSHYEELIGVPGRIHDEGWVAQARELASGEDEDLDVSAQTASSETNEHSGAGEHAAGPANLSGLRSVRSKALRGGEEGAHEGEVDDLKRIRGVGVLIEKKLNSLGVTSYRQVANWTLDDIDRISQQLEFKGRIERENWVEQARILASGGATEFSRRLDRRIN